MQRLILKAMTKLLIGAYARNLNPSPLPQQAIYFANHSSHLDTLAIWSSFPANYQKNVRPVAAKDYWDKGGIKGYLAKHILNVVMVARDKSSDNPLLPLMQALEKQDSLILFPEGTRAEKGEIGEFKSGIFHLAQAFPDIPLIPIYLDNTHRSLPKGQLLPLPFCCTAIFGPALYLEPNEEKTDFLQRARASITALIHSI